jgi:hypothetical protein
MTIEVTPMRYEQNSSNIPCDPLVTILDTEASAKDTCEFVDLVNKRRIKFTIDEN